MREMNFKLHDIIYFLTVSYVFTYTKRPLNFKKHSKIAKNYTILYR